MTNLSYPESNYPNLFQSVILIIIQIIAYSFILYLITGIGFLKNHDFSFLKNSSVQQVSYICSSLILVLYGLKKSGYQLPNLLKTHSDLMVLLLLIPFVIIGFSIIFSELNNFFRYIIHIPDSNLESALYFNNITGFLLSCIFAPVTEEIIYRGIVLNGYLKNYNSTIAIILSSLLYSLSQIYPGKIMITFIFGLFLSCLFFYTKSLIYPIWTHITINILNFMVQFNFIPNIRGFTPSGTDSNTFIQHQPTWFTIAGTVIAIISGWLLIKIITHYNKRF